MAVELEGGAEVPGAELAEETIAEADAADGACDVAMLPGAMLDVAR